MAPVTPPAYLQAGSYSGRLDRLALGGLLTPLAAVGPLKARSGVKPNSSNTSLQVTQRATPDRWVTIAAGTCYIGATSTTGGSYECHNDAAYDVQTAASHATLARKDLVVARVYDAVDDTGASNDFRLEVITGTPASSPARPATPNQALALAEVLVGAGTTTVTNANITDLRQRTVALGGVLPCGSSAELPTSPYNGMTVYRTDVKQTQVWDGTAWRVGYDTGYAYPSGCLGRVDQDCSPDFTTTSTSGITVKYDGTNVVRINFVMPSGVPSTRCVRVVWTMNVSITSGGRGSLGSLLDSSTLFFERRIAVPETGFGHQWVHVSLIDPANISPGSHYFEAKVSADTTSYTITVFSIEGLVEIV